MTAMARIVLAGGSDIARRAISAALSADPDIETITLPNSISSIVTSVNWLQPDLIALVMSDTANEVVEAARLIMNEAPKPVVLISPGPCEETTSLLSRSGALAVLQAPEGVAPQRRFLSALKAMAEVKVVRRWRNQTAVVPVPAKPLLASVTGQLVAIASSTGGPGALQQIFSELPPDFFAPILVVQHIAGGFVDGLIRSLSSSPLAIKLAVSGEALKPRTVYIAPDNRHLGVSSRDTIVLSAAPPIDGFRPSATFLFDSAAKTFGSRLTAVVLTGMGRDGVAGLRAVHEHGGTIIAQDRETSAVFGMPKAALEGGFVDRVLPLGAIARELAISTRLEGVSA